MFMRSARIVLLLALGVMPLLGCERALTGGIVVEYERTGGFAGFQDRMIIWDDGKVTLNRKGMRTEFTVDTDTVMQLLDALKQTDFAKLSRQPTPKVQGADLFEYAITYRRITVRAVDTAIPTELGPVIEILNRIVAGGTKT